MTNFSFFQNTLHALFNSIREKFQLNIWVEFCSVACINKNNLVLLTKNIFGWWLRWSELPSWPQLSANRGHRSNYLISATGFRPHPRCSTDVASCTRCRPTQILSTTDFTSFWFLCLFFNLLLIFVFVSKYLFYIPDIMLFKLHFIFICVQFIKCLLY